MVTNDATILRIKHDVLYEVAKLGGKVRGGEGGAAIPDDSGPAGPVPLLYL